MKFSPPTQKRECVVINQRPAAFTLLEVILAISIAVGLLLVALVFYRQATELRTQLLEESERLAAVRQLMDRLSAELRAAPAHDHAGFTGTADSLRFVMAGLPLQNTAPDSDLKLIAYGTLTSADGTNIVVSGLTRDEQPLVDLLPSALAPALATVAGDTNAPAVTGAALLTEAVHFLRFRFWDGADWRESWSAVAPPPAVEVSLGLEPLPSDATPDKYPYELFRRVIFLPAGVAAPPAATNSLTRVEQP